MNATAESPRAPRRTPRRNPDAIPSALFSASSAPRRLHFMSSHSGAIIFPDMIRRATIHDVPRMQEIINSHAELGKMLFKSYAQIYETLRDFAVYEDAGEVVGVTALAILWADLSEVRSLAVDDKHRGKGIGSKLVQWCIDEARRLQIRKLMSLTYEQKFFERLGFKVVSKESL